MFTNIEQYLPSRSFLKKIGFIILSIALIWGVIELFGYLKTKREQKLIAQPLVAPLVVNDITTIDENTDGIPDWKQNIQEILGVTPTADAGTDEKLNETEQFARDLFTTAATISQSGELTEEGAQTIAEQVSARIASTTLEDLFTEKDIKVVPATDTNKTRYFNDYVYLVSQKYPLDIDNSIQIMQIALDANDPSELAKLEPIITRYTNLIEALKKLSVPTNLKDGHLEFLNILGKARGSIQGMRNTFANPISAMSIMVNYPKILTQLVEYVGPFTTKIPYSTASVAK